MSLLVFQIIIRQWDKGQLTPEHVSQRAALPDRYSIVASPTFSLAGREFIFDQHGDDIPTSVFSKGRIQHAKLSGNQVAFDRFRIALEPEKLVLEYLLKDNEPVLIGNPAEGWIQCRYHWRYGVEESGQVYWMYENVILNGAGMADLDVDIFLKSDPAIIFTPPENRSNSS